MSTNDRSTQTAADNPLTDDCRWPECGSTGPGKCLTWGRYDASTSLCASDDLISVARRLAATDGPESNAARAVRRYDMLRRMGWKARMFRTHYLWMVEEPYTRLSLFPIDGDVTNG
jgi:hypothetical protein